jgi:hypothetical protein
MDKFGVVAKADDVVNAFKRLKPMEEKILLNFQLLKH